MSTKIHTSYSGAWQVYGPVQIVLTEAHARGLLNFNYDHLADLEKREASKVIEWLKEETE